MNFQELGEVAADSDHKNMARLVIGRHLQADADFFAYQCSNVDQPLGVAIKRCKEQIEYYRLMSGAEQINLHLTLGMKGGREQMASVKPYQEKRNANRDPKLSQRVAELRSFMSTYRTGNIKPVVNLFQEADDSMTQYQVERIKTHGIEYTVIMSGDKDLWMSVGKHVDMQTGEFWLVDGYGTISYKDTGNVKPKLVGRGTVWFWHQMIMGDTADNIPGLPKLSGRLCEKYLPLKKPNPKRKALQAGEAKAVAIFEGVTTDKVAAQRTLEAYQDHYGKVLGCEMLVEQAFLLWMRRTTNPLDCMYFLRECGITLVLSTNQKSALKRFKALVEIQQKRAKEQTLQCDS